jgi:hypothetical protein
MSVSGISSSSFVDYSAQNILNKRQQFRQEFQQLGQDLQSGNLSAAQADFATLRQLGPQNNPSSVQSNNPVAEDVKQLSQDLQSGNVSAAQQDYAKIQQDFQTEAVQARHRHPHHGGSRGGANAISRSLDQLGQALQSANLTAAQQAYSTLQQEFQQFGQSVGTLFPQASQRSSNSLSVNA